MWGDSSSDAAVSPGRTGTMYFTELALLLCLFTLYLLGEFVAAVKAID